MIENRTPGVFVKETHTGLNTLKNIPTAIPAFIGYTAKTEYMAQSMINIPKKVTSLDEFKKFFGGFPEFQFELIHDVAKPAGKKGKSAQNASQESESKRKEIEIVPDFEYNGDQYQLLSTGPAFKLYQGVEMFFSNGGSECFIVSVGEASINTQITLKDLNKGLECLLKIKSATLLSIPDSVNLPVKDYFKLLNKTLEHCGENMTNRFAIIDVYDGDENITDNEELLEVFRNGIKSEYTQYGASYFPFIKSCCIDIKNDVNFTLISNLERLQELIKDEIAEYTQSHKITTNQAKKYIDLVAQIKKPKKNQANGTSIIQNLHRTLLSLFKSYNLLFTHIMNKVALIPPGPAIAGIYTQTDKNYGIWKTPANIKVNGTLNPDLMIDDAHQEEIYNPFDGKTINPIRYVDSEGILVWGAKTLDGNNPEWKYINIRRTASYIKYLIQNEALKYVYEPNTENTWVNLKSALSGILRNLWRQGALIGSKPDEAFEVITGLGRTMSQEDVDKGILKVNIKLALLKPAEFIDINFEQKMNS